ncbi:MAG: toll/interleukin-1 receptor domain-containing protein [Acidiferrobacter sp.]
MTLITSVKRTLIFISHATPEDNDFTLWLGARLASAGYSVWSDVTKLIGGETH